MQALKWILPSLLLFVAAASFPAAAAPTAAVTVVDFAFQPTAVTIDRDVNNAIVFTYDPAGFTIHQPKSDPHNSAAEGACLNMLNPITPGQTISVAVTLTPLCLATAKSVGLGSVTFGYHCHIHPGMLGTVTVNL